MWGPISVGVGDYMALPEIKLLNRFLLPYTDQTLTWFAVGIIAFALFASIFMKNTNERLDKFKPNIRTAIVSAILLAYSIVSLSGISTFLYFNF